MTRQEKIVPGARLHSARMRTSDGEAREGARLPEYEGRPDSAGRDVRIGSPGPLGLTL